jgi:hypothetical protein
MKKIIIFICVVLIAVIGNVVFSAKNRVPQSRAKFVVGDYYPN